MTSTSKKLVYGIYHTNQFLSTPHVLIKQYFSLQTLHQADGAAGLDEHRATTRKNHTDHCVVFLYQAAHQSVAYLALQDKPLCLHLMLMRKDNPRAENHQHTNNEQEQLRQRRT